MNKGEACTQQTYHTYVINVSKGKVLLHDSRATDDDQEGRVDDQCNEEVSMNTQSCTEKRPAVRSVCVCVCVGQDYCGKREGEGKETGS